MRLTELGTGVESVLPRLEQNAGIDIGDRDGIPTEVVVPNPCCGKSRNNGLGTDRKIANSHSVHTRTVEHHPLGIAAKTVGELPVPKGGWMAFAQTKNRGRHVVEAATLRNLVVVPKNGFVADAAWVVDRNIVAQFSKHPDHARTRYQVGKKVDRLRTP